MAGMIDRFCNTGPYPVRLFVPGVGSAFLRSARIRVLRRTGH